MTRKTGIVLTVLGALVISASSVFAVAAKFHAVSGSVDNSGALVVSFDERGLGEGNIDYTLRADATSLWACINGGGKNPSAANKRTEAGQVSGGGSFASRNGRVQASVTAGPLGPGDFACPNGQRLVLAAVTYTNIVLCDTTNNSCTGVPNVSRTFLNV
jgi:hypothetical protein